MFGRFDPAKFAHANLKELAAMQAVPQVSRILSGVKKERDHTVPLFLFALSERTCRVEPNRPDVSRRETQDEPEGFAATLEASGIYLSTMPRFAAPSRAWTTLALSHS